MKTKKIEPKVIDSFTGEYAFLSNFCIVPGGIKMLDQTFPSVENAYQAAKVPDDMRAGFWLKHTYCTPAQSKKLGNQLTLRKDWDKVKVGIMQNLCVQKFNEPALEALLLNTGDQVLIEGNTWNDTFWGVCKGVGMNMLGKILMDIRLQKNLNK